MASVVVTGAAHGLGAALAEGFVRRGDSVALLDLDAAAAAERAAALEKHGAPVLGIGCDVTSSSDCTAAIGQVVSAWGGVDVLVANAGITHVGRVEETDGAVFRRVMDVNFFGAVHATRAALASLRERRGHVVALSSVAGFAPLATRAGYAASKHAVEGFFATLRAECEGDGLAVTLVRPSFVRTGIGRRALGPGGSPAEGDARSGVGHEISVEDAAGTVLRALSRRPRVVWVGREARLAWWVSRAFPRMYERQMVRRTLR